MLKSIDTTLRNPSGSLRAFITITIDKQDYEHMIDLPIGVENVEAYVKAHINDIEADILGEFIFDEDYSFDKSLSKLDNIKKIIADKKIAVKPYRKHPEKIGLKMQYDKAKDMNEQVNILAKAVFGG
jgi:hypothetical protein